jgi:hypothetical protein
MQFSHTIEYDAAPDEVYAMLADADFREKVCLAMHAVENEVSIETDGEGMSVVVDQTQPAHGIPSFAKKFVGDTIHIRQREEWSSATNATLDVTIPGKPGHMHGTVRLAGDSGGTTETVTVEVKVSIPLIGGKIEGFIGDMLTKALRAENKVGRQWLAEHS